ncbi:ABC transporter substrate-binding protein [Ilumatobacter sp.]|uniref:ABC transporter substrate-binding protein n=1 Tax=Ilumatobacter sp. TaxID=1967498 RepID=UPI003B518B0B
MRIASLLPSATEIVHLLGVEDDLVGVSFECDFPPDPRADHPVLVGGLATEGLSPSEIDALVRERVAAGDDLYRLDDEAFRRARPDVVLTQDLCRVCALAAGDTADALARLGSSAEVVTLDPRTLDDVLDSIAAVADAVGVTERAEGAIAELRRRLAEVARRTLGAHRPRTFVLEWIDPPFPSGHWVPDLVEAAGGEAVLARRGERSIPTRWDLIVESDPDVVVVAPCGFDLDGSAAQAADVLDLLPGRAEVWAIDADGLVVRPGPRLVEGVEALATVLHPTLHDGPHPAVRRIR